MAYCIILFTDFEDQNIYTNNQPVYFLDVYEKRKNMLKNGICFSIGINIFLLVIGYFIKKSIYTYFMIRVTAPEPPVRRNLNQVHPNSQINEQSHKSVSEVKSNYSYTFVKKKNDLLFQVFGREEMKKMKDLDHSVASQSVKSKINIEIRKSKFKKLSLEKYGFEKIKSQQTPDMAKHHNVSQSSKFVPIKKKSSFNLGSFKESKDCFGKTKGKNGANNHSYSPSPFQNQIKKLNNKEEKELDMILDSEANDSLYDFNSSVNNSHSQRSRAKQIFDSHDQNWIAGKKSKTPNLDNLKMEEENSGTDQYSSLSDSMEEIYFKRKQRLNKLFEKQNKKKKFTSIKVIKENSKNQIEEEEKKEDFDSDICIICMVNQRDAIFRPCGHGSCCFECAKKVIEENPICYYCRQVNLFFI